VASGAGHVDLTAATEAVELQLGRWIVYVRGRRAMCRALRDVLSAVVIPEDDLPSLQIVISPTGRATGTIGGNEAWSLELPKRGWLAALVGYAVGTATSVLRGLLFVHAAAVEIHGQGYVLVGAPGAGKTSAAAVLVRGGAGYLSDEIALLDPKAGILHPFAVPLAVKPWTIKAAGTLPAVRRVASEGGVTYLLPSRRAPGPVPLEAMVLLDPAPRTPGVQTPRLVEVPRAEMLLALSQHASSFRYRPRLESAFSGFVRLLRHARCVKVTAAAPAEAAAAVASLSAL